MVGFTKSEKPTAFRTPVRLYKHASRCIKKIAMVFSFYGLRDPEFVLGYLQWLEATFKTFGFFYHGTYLNRCWFTQQGVFVLLWWCGVLYDGSCCGWCVQGFSELFWCPYESMFGGAKCVELIGFQSFHVGTSGDYALKKLPPTPPPPRPQLFRCVWVHSMQVSDIVVSTTQAGC